MSKTLKGTLFLAIMAACSALAAQTASGVGTVHHKTQVQTRPNAATLPQAPASQQRVSPRVGLPQTQQPAQQPAAQPQRVATQPVQPGTAQNPQPVGSESPAQSASFAPKIAASAPRVSFQNGQLTVIADNSGLGEVLNAVRSATGMKIEGPTGGAERVTAKIGPAPVRDVLLSLLEGSHYDFAMLGAVSDPQKIERLVLTPKSAAAPSNYVAQQQPQQQPAEDAAGAQPASSDDDDNEGFAEPAKPAATTPPPTQPQVKTPEQLLEDLKKIEADKAQQQQAQPVDPNNPRPPRPERPK